MVRAFCAFLAVLGLSTCGTDKTLTTPEISSPQTVVEEQETDETQQPTGMKPGYEESALKITVGEHEFLATFEENSSAEEFKALLSQGALTVEMEDYGGFEKVGAIGTELTRNDAQITTEPGDVILYQGDQITIYYGRNSWNFTRLAKIDDTTDLREKLGDGTVLVTFSLE